jgi:hypothetical protein
MKETATAGTTTLFRNFRRAVISGPFQLALVAAAAEAAQQSARTTPTRTRITAITPAGPIRLA